MAVFLVSSFEFLRAVLGRLKVAYVVICRGIVKTGGGEGIRIQTADLRGKLSGVLPVFLSNGEQGQTENGIHILRVCVQGFLIRVMGCLQVLLAVLHIAQTGPRSSKLGID